ncbi:hypothetical protein N0V90_011244 [Kalmusia sp. IMI 367209]|nr:hypothetical protein N0V90_011244 [Kalmusia sp. IMI 367209]
MHFTKFLSTLFVIGAVSAIALPDTEQDQSDLVDNTVDTNDGDSTENITARATFASVTTCLTTWSGNNCRGSSKRFQGTILDPNGCTAIPFGSYTLDC